MGAKKTGLTDTEYGKELFVAVGKLEAQKEEARPCREKIIVDVEIERETKITIKDGNMQDLYSTVVQSNSQFTSVRVILANTMMGHGYYLHMESTDGKLKKKIFVETNR